MTGDVGDPMKAESDTAAEGTAGQPPAWALGTASRRLAGGAREIMLFSVWQDYALDVRGEALPAGHFLPEEAPGLVIAALREFLD